MRKKDWYREYLVKCAGFGDAPWDQELDEMLVKWKNAAKKLGLTEDDHQYVVTEWIPENFDISLEGVRKTIGVMTAEFADMMMATDRKEKGEKLVYGLIPCHSPFYTALKYTDPSVNVYCPDISAVNLIQPFFHKLSPHLAYAEDHGVRVGCRHCALNKTRYAMLRQGLIPLPDVSWIWGFICDQAPKSDEFIREYWNKDYNTVFSRFSHHGFAHELEYENDEMVKYLGSIMRDGYEQVCKTIGVKVDEEAIIKALGERMDYMHRYAELADLMASDPPPLSGRVSLFLNLPPASIFNTGYKYANDALDAVIKDAKEKVNKGEGVVPKGSPKGMIWFIPYCIPFVVKIFEENGVAIPYSEGFLPSKAELIPPTYSDPFDANAQAFLKWSLTQNWGAKADLAIEKMETYNVDFMIWGFMDFDRWLGSDHKLCSRYVEEKTGKSCFYIEGDIWDDRDYSEGALRSRIETICQIVKTREVFTR
ncbi:MAG: 2-hydroxyacyl-CoA dehydratase [Dissulfuribacterales bacterium]